MKDAIKAITLLFIDSATLTGAYDPFVATGLPQACSIIRIVNDSNTGVGFSYDGINTHEFIPAGLTTQIYMQIGSRPNNKKACVSKGSNVCLIGNAGVGTIYLIGYYQE